ncbi:MAG: TrkA family potassium uptake protein [Burkholderiales bacterium]|nr:TrkA family potassium uptake protein [Burkholderiales bacterium]
MRAVFVGAGALTVMTARHLVRRRHEVVIIERDRERIESLAEELDCGFLHGDGAKPAVLREADPEHTDVLFCLTGSDEANIIAALVGDSLGFGRVVARIEDPELEHICIELGLEDTIIPTRTISRFLADMFEGRDPLELSAMMRGDARVFSFVAREEDARPAGELGLPERSRIICVYRDEELVLPDGDTPIKKGDEVIVMAAAENLAELEARWGKPRPARRTSRAKPRR